MDGRDAEDELTYQRIMEPSERAVLQGLDPTLFEGLTNQAALRIIGNAFSVPTVGSILHHIVTVLRHGGLVQFWPRELALPAGGPSDAESSSGASETSEHSDEDSMGDGNLFGADLDDQYVPVAFFGDIIN